MKRLILPLLALSCLLPAQFIPDKSVVIHPAVESKPERQGATEGPGAGLGTTPPSTPVPRAPRPGRTGGPPPIPPPPPAPQISAAGAAIEQTTQGNRAAIQPEAAFDALGEGFTGHEFPGADNANAGRGGGAEASTSAWQSDLITSSRS